MKNKNKNSIDKLFDNISELTKLQRILIFFGSILIITGVFVWFLYMPKYNEINALKEEYSAVDAKIQRAKIKARKLEKLKKEWEAAQLRFSVVMEALPEKKEIPTLLTNISQSGNSSGLQFVTFKPQKEVVKDFYAELPITISVTGGYHNVGVFLDLLARLNRIVTIRDLRLKQDSKNADVIITTFQAVTYKFIEPKNTPQSKKKK
ncbi:MAG: protein PilO [Deltaproteobacteria bacterium]|nr:MAG: protein PilO [Deltaproteobacteria bacterium]